MLGTSQPGPHAHHLGPRFQRASVNPCQSGGSAIGYEDVAFVGNDAGNDAINCGVNIVKTLDISGGKLSSEGALG